MNIIEIDAIMTLIPEAQCERIAVGTPCLDRNGKRFTVLGAIDYTEYIQNSAHLWYAVIKHNFVQDGALVLGLSYDAAAPDQ